MYDIIILIVLTIASYFFGNINWAIIISKLKKMDIRKMGSGNPGTLNMSRNLGLGLGLLTFFLDIMKGVIPTLTAYFVFRDKFYLHTEFRLYNFSIYLCGLAVVVGHIFPAIFKFKGGKGIASTIGVFLVCEFIPIREMPYGWSWAIIMVMALVAATVFIYLTEFGAMGSFIAITPPAISSSIRLFLSYGATVNHECVILHLITNMLILAICVFTWTAHRHNIKRMLAGEEHPTSIKEMVVKMKAKKLKQKQEALNSVSSDK